MEVHKEEAPAGTGASDRRSDLILCGRSQDLYGKYTTPQVETVDDLGWGSIPIAYLFTEEKSDGFWRLQTEDAHLKKRMKTRVWNPRSPHRPVIHHMYLPEMVFFHPKCPSINTRNIGPWRI